MRWLTYLMAANNLLRRLRRFTRRAHGLLVVGGRVLAGLRQPGRADADLRCRRPPPAAQRGARNLSAVRPGAPAAVAGRADPGPAGAISLASAPWVPYYARALGAKIGDNVQLHSLPPVTGLLSLGSGCNIEPEVDLSGWWIDGDVVHIGAIHVGAGATVGARSTLMPGATIGAGAQVEPGSAVSGKVKAGQLVAGSPAERRGKARHSWPDSPAEHRLIGRLWFAGFAAASAVLALIPYVSAAAAALVVFAFIRGSDSLLGGPARMLLSLPLAALAWFLTNLVLILGTTRLLGMGLAEGYYRVRSRIGWQVWATERVLDLARDLLFPIYASLFTPVWLRLLGAKVGQNVEASTVLLIPKMTTVGEGAFLADDTMVASYELDGGWMRIAPAKIGKRSFLGNSGMTAAGRNVPKNSLVAVLSATPAKAKSGTSWLGSPPVRLRRTAIASDDTRTYQPPRKLKVARALWELCRFVPVMLTVAIAVGVLLAFDCARDRLQLRNRRRPGRGGDPAGRGHGRGQRRRGEMAAGGPHPARRASAVELLHLAQRGGGHLHRDGQRPVVRARCHRDPGAGLVAAGTRRENRRRHLVRKLLAARGGPRHPRQELDRQPRVRRPDPSIP